MALENFLLMMNENYPIFYMLATYLLLFLVLVLLWFLVSFPFLIVKGAVGEVLSKFILWTKNSQLKLKESAKNYYVLFLSPFKQLIEDSSYRYIVDEEEIKINQELQQIKKNIEGTRSEIESFGEKARNSLSSIKSSLANILNINTPPEYPAINIQVPSIRIEKSVNEEKRQGFIKFMIFIPVGFFLIVLNTFLLEKFFTIFTSDYIIYSLGIKYSHLIALFYSIAELALGVGFVFSKNNRSFQVMILIFIACLAFLEVYIYLYLGLQFAGFEFSDMATLRGWEILEASWMSPFGLAISGVLFIAGHFVTDGILEYRRGQDLEIFKNELDFLHQKASDIDQFFSNSNDIARQLPQDFNDLNEASAQQLVDSEENVVASDMKLSELHARLTALLYDVEQVRLNPFTQVSEIEAKRLVFLHGFFGCMIILISFFFITFQTGTSSNIFSFIQIGLLLGASYLLSESLVIVTSETTNEVVLNPKSSFLISFCYLTIAAIIGFILYSNISVEKINWLSIFASLFCVAGCLWLGRHLKEILSIAVAALQSSYFIALSLTNIIFSWVLAFLRGISNIIESILSLFTFPARKFNGQIFGDKT